MSKKFLLIFLSAILIPSILFGCIRVAAPAPLPTATSESPLNTPEGGGMFVISESGTATANSATLTAQATPDEPTATPTPLAEVTLAPSTPLPTGISVPVVTPIATLGPSVRPATYTLQPGEYPYCIARRYNLNPQDLLALNGLSRDQIYPAGTVLRIPQTGTFPGERALHPHPTQYTVSVNDTIYRIACYFGDVDPAEIAAANDLIPPYTLTVGTVLNIP